MNNFPAHSRTKFFFHHSAYYQVPSTNKLRRTVAKLELFYCKGEAN